MCPKRPQYVPGNVAAFRLSSAGPHGLDGDQGSTGFREEREREDGETWVKYNVLFVFTLFMLLLIYCYCNSYPAIVLFAKNLFVKPNRDI